MKHIIKGDLLEVATRDNIDVIVHGCNCFHTMGSGLAPQVKKKYPEAFEEDLKTPYGDKNKLGDFSYYYSERDRVYIINAYTQFYGGANYDYGAIQYCFEKIGNYFGNWHIAYPQVGAGIAGGNWEIIDMIIDDALRGCERTLVIYDPSEGL